MGKEGVKIRMFHGIRTVMVEKVSKVAIFSPGKATSCPDLLMIQPNCSLPCVKAISHLILHRHEVRVELGQVAPARRRRRGPGRQLVGRHLVIEKMIMK